jgi:O-6-methylguanine DNA methyltransferase
MRVLAALQAIPRGATQTYGAIAGQLGTPRAARAVGAACGANPLPLFIPCHRVVAAHGALGGFSAGRAWKKFLLAKEPAG